MFSSHPKSDHSFLRSAATLSLAAQFFVMAVMLTQVLTYA